MVSDREASELELELEPAQTCKMIRVSAMTASVADETAGARPQRATNVNSSAALRRWQLKLAPAAHASLFEQNWSKEKREGLNIKHTRELGHTQKG